MSGSETSPGESTPTPEPPDDAEATEASTASTGTRSDPLRGSRTSGLWIGVVLISVVLVLLIIFIAQNTDPVRIRFLGWDGEAPLAVALLAATVAGLVLAAVAGTLRILQLRRRVRRESR